jgi:hypothetical protein
VDVGGSATDHAASGGAVIAMAGINLITLVTISQCPEEPDMNQCRDSKNRQRKWWITVDDQHNIMNQSLIFLIQSGYRPQQSRTHHVKQIEI